MTAARSADSYTGSLGFAVSWALSSSAGLGDSIMTWRSRAVIPSALVATVASSEERSMMNSAAPVSP